MLIEMNYWSFAVVIIISVIPNVYTVKDSTDNYFSVNKLSRGRYPTNKVILKVLLKTHLGCAYRCLLETRCAAFLLDGLQCYILETSMHDQITDTTTITGAKYYELRGEMKTWRIQVWTGSSSQAGTDNLVLITIYGTTGAMSSAVRLDDPDKDDFERGNLDTFYITVSDFGVPWRVKITYKITTSDTDWELNGVILCDLVAQLCYNFNAAVWLSPSTSMSVVLEQSK